MKTINATKGDFVQIINGLFNVQILSGKDFSLIISKNINILKDKLKDLEDMGKPSEKFMELAKEVNLLSSGDDENAKAKIDKLEEENKDLVEERRAQLEKVAEVMKEEISVELHVLSEDLLPETVTANQINNLIKIIE